MASKRKNAASNGTVISLRADWLVVLPEGMTPDDTREIVEAANKDFALALAQAGMTPLMGQIGAQVVDGEVADKARQAAAEVAPGLEKLRAGKATASLVDVKELKKPEAKPAPSFGVYL